MRKMKILVIFTGGTIGSSVSDGMISTDPRSCRELIARYVAANGNDIDFDFKEPYTVLSENLCARELNLLTQTVCDSLGEGYDGIIVTHGTDTLQYSAAALSYAVGSESIPVMLVSSNYPLSDERTNGNANFGAAVEFIKNGCGKGVYAPYRNSDGVVYFHQGLSMTAHGEADDNLMSYGDRYYARSDENGITVCGGEYRRITPCGALTLDDDPRILVITAHPADSFSYDLSDCKAVIMRPYHSGTLNTASKAFARFCEKALDGNIPVYVANAVKGITYESSADYDKLGIIRLYGRTLADAFIRLWAELN